MLKQILKLFSRIALLILVKLGNEPEAMRRESPLRVGQHRLGARPMRRFYVVFFPRLSVGRFGFQDDVKRHL